MKKIACESIVHSLVGILYFSCVVSSVQAIIPEPPAIVYGTLQDSTGKSIPEGNLQIIFRPVTDAARVTARTYIPASSGPVEFSLRLPVETGAIAAGVNAFQVGEEYVCEFLYNGVLLRNVVLETSNESLYTIIMLLERAMEIGPLVAELSAEQPPIVSPTPTETPSPQPPSDLPKPVLVYEFDRPILIENGWAEIPGGFAGADAGSISPLDFTMNPALIPSSQDKRGLAMAVGPGRVACAYAVAPIRTNGKPALMRMTIRANAADASIFLVGLKGSLVNWIGVDGSLALNNAVSSASMLADEWQLVLLSQFDGTETITPIIQVVGTGQVETVCTVLIDRLEIYLVDSDTEYPCRYLTSVAGEGAGSVAVSDPAPAGIYEFSETSLAMNPWSVKPGGFGGAPAGLIEIFDFSPYGYLIPSSRDRKGIAITVQPGQVVFAFAQNPVVTQNGPVLMRATVQSDGPHASIWLVGLKGALGSGQGFDGSLTYANLASVSSLVTNERDLILLYEPDSGSVITPAIQVAGTGNSGLTTVLIDRIEGFKLSPNYSYPGWLFTSN